MMIELFGKSWNYFINPFRNTRNGSPILFPWQLNGMAQKPALSVAEGFTRAKESTIGTLFKISPLKR
jgi:hypothetical protein